MWWKKHKRRIIIPVVIGAVLAGVFYYGGNAPGARGWRIAETPPPVEEVTEDMLQPAEIETAPLPEEDPAAASNAEAELAEPAEPAEAQIPSAPQEEKPAAPEPAKAAATPAPSQKGAADAPASAPAGAKEPEPKQEIDPETGKDKYQTDPVPVGKPLPVEPQDTKVGMASYTCTMSISCATILDNLELCDSEKVELVPEDGWILKPITATFYEGESVFNVLQRICKQEKIHMEFMNTPIYNSAYIEGIHNLYEFDVGELSGWMYKVNEWFPNYGCSRYQLKDGDIINWVYTCDLGYDVGGGYATGS